MEKHKRGDVREDGKVFYRIYMVDGQPKEAWVTPEYLVAERSKRAGYTKKYKQRNPVKAAEISKESSARYYRSHPERRKAYAVANRARIAENARIRRARDPEKTKAIGRERYSTSKEACLAATQRWRQKKAGCLIYRLGCAMRSRVHEVLKKKAFRSLHYVGCDLPFLMTHLESQFVDGMSWDNYGKWHVDHVIPLASGKTLDAIIPLFHYSNLQPLWAFDNLSKGAKMV